jgi:hypothetical protein
MKVIRITGNIFVILGVFVWVTASVAAAESIEFSKVGSKITAESTGAYFALSGGEVSCESGKGEGTVKSTKILTLHVTFEKCESFLGSEYKKGEASITSCGLELTNENKIALESGCKIETSSSCVIEPSTTELLSEVDFARSEEKETELYIGANMGGVTYKVNKQCESAGVKAGSAEVITNLTEQGAAAQPPRSVRVENAGPGAAEKTMVLKNLASTIITMTFPTNNGSAREIMCSTMKARGATPDERSNPRTIGAFAYEGCEANIFNAATFVMMNNSGRLTPTNTNCVMGMLVSSQPLGGLMSAFMRFSEGAHLGCTFEGSVTEGGNTCTIKFTGYYIDNTWIKNEAGPPRTIGVWYSYTNRRPSTREYMVTGNCGNGIAPRGDARQKGEASLSVEGGTAIEVV